MLRIITIYKLNCTLETVCGFSSCQRKPANVFQITSLALFIGKYVIVHLDKSYKSAKTIKIQILQMLHRFFHIHLNWMKTFRKYYQLFSCQIQLSTFFHTDLQTYITKNPRVKQHNTRVMRVSFTSFQALFTPRHLPK